MKRYSEETGEEPTSSKKEQLRLTDNTRVHTENLDSMIGNGQNVATYFQMKQ